MQVNFEEWLFTVLLAAYIDQLFRDLALNVIDKLAKQVNEKLLVRILSQTVVSKDLNQHENAITFVQLRLALGEQFLHCLYGFLPEIPLDGPETWLGQGL